MDQVQVSTDIEITLKPSRKQKQKQQAKWSQPRDDSRSTGCLDPDCKGEPTLSALAQTKSMREGSLGRPGWWVCTHLAPPPRTRPHWVDAAGALTQHRIRAGLVETPTPNLHKPEAARRHLRMPPSCSCLCKSRQCPCFHVPIFTREVLL